MRKWSECEEHVVMLQSDGTAEEVKTQAISLYLLSGEYKTFIFGLV